jgi:hypothetical protein
MPPVDYLGCTVRWFGDHVGSTLGTLQRDDNVRLMSRQPDRAWHRQQIHTEMPAITRQVGQLAVQHHDAVPLGSANVNLAGQLIGGKARL